MIEGSAAAVNVYDDKAQVKHILLSRFADIRQCIALLCASMHASLCTSGTYKCLKAHASMLAAKSIHTDLCLQLVMLRLVLLQHI